MGVHDTMIVDKPKFLSAISAFTGSIFLVLLLTSCAPKLTKPAIGMHIGDFHQICGFEVRDEHTITDAQGETRTFTISATNFNGSPNPVDCVGKFTFTNSKLTSIAR